jgi:uncharacterized protein with NRDE domain
MCILALYFQKLRDHSLIVAANRDELLSRPSDSPQVLADDPLIFGGKDLVAGGTWLAINKHGLLAGVLNRRSGGQKQVDTRRSRGLLCSDVLKSKDAGQACDLLKREEASSYQPFNLLFANEDAAYVAYNVEDRIECKRLEEGLHVVSNTSIYDPPSRKLDYAHSLFSDAGRRLVREDFDGPSFTSLFQGILENHSLREGTSDPKEAICVHTGDYGTVSSTIISYSGTERRFTFYHASGPPCRSEYEMLLSLETS